MCIRHSSLFLTSTISINADLYRLLHKLSLHSTILFLSLSGDFSWTQHSLSWMLTTYTYFILALPVVVLFSPDQWHWLHQIYGHRTGVDDPSCWEGGYSTPCLSFNLALTEAQHYNHALHYSSSTWTTPASQWVSTQEHVLKAGHCGYNSSQGDVIIRCEPLAGLAFFWSEEINMINACQFG